VDYNTLPEKGKRKRFSGDMVYLLMAAWAAEDTPGGRTWLIQTALDVSREAEIIRRYRIKVEIALAAGVFISVIAGVFIARRGLRPLNEITKVIQLVRATQLHERINPSQWPKELTVLATSFDEMLSRLQDSFNRLSQFSSDLAHELRTPINNLMGEAEVALAKPRSPEEYQQVLGSSLEELRHLLHMIESLLFLARAESTDIRIESTVFDPVKEIEAVLDYYDALIEEKQLRITCQWSVSLRADPLLFRRVINNVLSNAIKYTPAGGAVGITVVRTESGVTITVGDSGIGIAADELENIFSRFYRGRATRSLDAKGAGLGLAIVKSIMDLHGGSINIQSEPSKGTIITLSFPQAS
jgi:two-component system heavy metal sensor histidine kinase CusS